MVEQQQQLLRVFCFPFPATTRLKSTSPFSFLPLPFPIAGISLLFFFSFSASRPSPVSVLAGSFKPAASSPSRPAGIFFFPLSTCAAASSLFHLNRSTIGSAFSSSSFLVRNFTEDSFFFSSSSSSSTSSSWPAIERGQSLASSASRFFLRRFHFGRLNRLCLLLPDFDPFPPTLTWSKSVYSPAPCLSSFNNLHPKTFFFFFFFRLLQLSPPLGDSVLGIISLSTKLG